MPDGKSYILDIMIVESIKSMKPFISDLMYCKFKVPNNQNQNKFVAKS